MLPKRLSVSAIRLQKPIEIARSVLQASYHKDLLSSGSNIVGMIISLIQVNVFFPDSGRAINSVVGSNAKVEV
jgi:hypothetical protein